MYLAFANDTLEYRLSIQEGLTRQVQKQNEALSNKISKQDSQYFTGKVWIEKNPSQQCANKTLQQFQTGTVVGMSMRPTIWPGDTTLQVPFDPSKPLVEGDMVIANGTLHRIYALYDGYFLMMGDNNEVVDYRRYNITDIQTIVCGVLAG